VEIRGIQTKNFKTKITKPELPTKGIEWDGYEDGDENWGNHTQDMSNTRFTSRG